MSIRSLTRGFALLLPVVLLLPGCPARRVGPANDVFCKTGNYSKSHPLLCIDEKTLSVNPSRAVVFDFEADERNRSTRRPVIVHWFTQRPANVEVRFEERNECVETVHCDKSGHCWTQVKPPKDEASARVERRCSYGITMGSSDPVSQLVITPCCWTDNAFNQ